MNGESFRFLHAGDFHLERPLGDLDELPQHLADSLAAAPWRAAESVFEAAIVEGVDFVVLSGNVLNPSAAGPRGIALLVDYFSKLAEQQIPVFWAAGETDDPAKWPEAIRLPENVTLFPKGRTESFPVIRNGQTLCLVVGRSSEGRSAIHVPSYRQDPTDHFTVAVGSGSSTAETLAEGRFDYWALGGSKQRKQFDNVANVGAIYCGSPQGRNLNEPGAHGYTLVDVDPDGNGRVHHVDADRFRYCSIKLDASEMAGNHDIRTTLTARIHRLQHEHGDHPLLLAWDLSLSSECLQSVGDPGQLLKWLRQDFGHGKPEAWTVQLTVRPPQDYPTSWREEDTILGDFLRAVERNRKGGSGDVNLKPFTEEHHHLPASVATLLAEPASTARAAMLDQAALLGVDLLRGGKVKP